MNYSNLSDAHTHSLASNNGIIALEPREAHFHTGKVYSVGIHPWSVSGASESDWELVERLCANPQVIAIGESGLDRLRGGDLQRQAEIFTRHISLSESLRKPLIIHNVRCSAEILAMRKTSRATQPWILHGFRGNALTAKQFCDSGIMLSFGEKFRPGVPQSVPEDMILAETDMSLLPIEQIALSVCPDNPDLPGRNLRRLLKFTDRE